VLARTGKGTTLYIRGRDVEEQEKAIVFNKANCRWSITGDAEEVHMAESRRKIVTLLNDVTKCHEPLGPKDIALQCDMPETLSRKTLSRMVEKGEIVKVSRGYYVSASRSDRFRKTLSQRSHVTNCLKVTMGQK
jgi:predicted transcriptional regulator